MSLLATLVPAADGFVNNFSEGVAAAAGVEDVASKKNKTINVDKPGESVFPSLFLVFLKIERVESRPHNRSAQPSAVRRADSLKGCGIVEAT